MMRICVLWVLIPCVVFAKSSFFPDINGVVVEEFFAQYRVVFLYFALLLLFFTALVNLMQKHFVNVFLHLGLVLLFLFIMIGSVFVSANPNDSKMFFLSKISMFVSLGVFLSMLPCFIMSVCIHFENRAYFFELSSAKKIANSALSFFVGIGLVIVAFGLSVFLSKIGADIKQKNFDNISISLILSLCVFVGILYVIYRESSLATHNASQRILLFLQHGSLSFVAILAINLVMRYLL